MSYIQAYMLNELRIVIVVGGVESVERNRKAPYVDVHPRVPPNVRPATPECLDTAQEER